MGNFLLFETSWEVCNKVGGIYAVLSTKARTLSDRYGDRLVFVGPDLWRDGGESPFFIADDALTRRLAGKDPLPMGVTVRAGRWDVPGQPQVLLVSFRHLQGRLDAVYGEMWERFGVDSLHAYGDYDEGCAFAVAAAVAVDHVSRRIATKNTARVVAHFDEWTTGMGLLWLKARRPDVRTVFTTHATCIGRSIAGNGKPLYDCMPGYNGDQMAAELNMQSKHSLEKAAALAADTFTTVSQVTARECQQLIGRRPTVTPNAFEQRFVPPLRQLYAQRAAVRRDLIAMVESLTGMALGKDTMLIATSGRQEMRNKGIDAYLDAVNVLATAVGDDPSQRPVVALVMVPGWCRQPRPDLLGAIKNRDRKPLDRPFITHELNNYDADPIVAKIRATGLDRLDGKLRVVYMPCYLSPDDGLLGRSYFQVLSAMDVTVFPSYYEPWGYTPLESVAFGVPTVTTDLAGFGQWVLDERGADPDATGVTVVHRTDANYHDTVHRIAAELTDYYHRDRKATLARSHAALDTAARATWETFIRPYIEAYEQ